MTNPPNKKSGDIRKTHNQDLIRRMRKGDTLCTFDSKASWFPPRPVIEKDRKEIARLYDGEDQRQGSKQKSPVPVERKYCEGKSRVIHFPRLKVKELDPLDDAG